jgi:uncharacterized membrane protein YgcG
MRMRFVPSAMAGITIMIAALAVDRSVGAQIQYPNEQCSSGTTAECFRGETTECTRWSEPTVVVGTTSEVTERQCLSYRTTTYYFYYPPRSGGGSGGSGSSGGGDGGGIGGDGGGGVEDLCGDPDLWSDDSAGCNKDSQNAS